VTIYYLRLVESPHPLTQNTPPSPSGREVLEGVAYISFSVLCSKGTYIRQLAVDIGSELGCGACLSKLERTYSHPFHISQALNMDTIVTLAKINKLSTVIISPEEVLESKELAQGG
jgi:tRNA U55 pseudouridine synthase TruB